MSRLDEEPDVIEQARKLGLSGRGDPVQAVVGHCLDRIRCWVQIDGPVATIGRLESLVARRLHMVFEEVETDEALDALIRKYVKLGEGVFAYLKHDLDGETFGATYRRSTVPPEAPDRLVAIVLSDGLGRYGLHVHSLFRELGKEKAYAQLAARAKKSVGLAKLRDEDLAYYFGDGNHPRLDLFGKYFVVFEEEKTKAARQKAEELKAEFNNWVRAKVHAQSDRERERINATLRQLEVDIEKWEAHSISLDDQLAEVRSRLSDYRRQIEATAKTLSGSENLRKAELVRRMFKAIVLHFRPIQKAKIRDCEFLPDKTEFLNSLEDDSS